jgi:lipoprotein-releasing system permease protein
VRKLATKSTKSTRNKKTLYLTFAWRYFKAKKSANAINIIAWVTTGVIAFATMCQVLVMSVFNGFEGLVKSLYASFYSDIRVNAAKGKTIQLTDAQISSMSSLPGIKAVSLIAEEKALLQNGEQQTVVLLKGVDSAYPQVAGVAQKTTQGIFNTGNADNPGLIVGAGIQSAAGISVDAALPSSHVTLIMPKKTGNSNSSPDQAISEGNAEATGVFTIQQDFDSRYVITNLAFVKQQAGLQPNEYTAAELSILPGANANDVAAALQKLLPGNYTILTKFEQNPTLYSTMQLEKWAIFAVLTLILIIAAFNMLSALTMLVLEKQKDINVLQSMGATKGLIQKIFLSEGLLLGGIGTGIGVLLALLVCWLQVKFKLIKLEGGSFLIDYFPIKIVLTDMILVAGTALFITLLASWLPSRKAAGQAFELR